MKRITYLLKNEDGNVQARMVRPEEESVSLEPWMVHNINQRGWRLEAWETTDSGVQIHGWADWQGVADTLAVVVGMLLDEDMPWDSDVGAEEFLDQAQAALDDYHVAQMEVSVAQADADPETEEEEEPDGPE